MWHFGTTTKTPYHKDQFMVLGLHCSTFITLNRKWRPKLTFSVLHQVSLGKCVVLYFSMYCHTECCSYCQIPVPYSTFLSPSQLLETSDYFVIFQNYSFSSFFIASFTVTCYDNFSISFRSLASFKKKKKISFHCPFTREYLSKNLMMGILFDFKFW